MKGRDVVVTSGAVVVTSDAAGARIFKVRK
jgi:hypothetical protein